MVSISLPTGNPFPSEHVITAQARAAENGRVFRATSTRPERRSDPHFENHLPLDVRAMVSQEHESSIHVGFKLSLRSIISRLYNTVQFDTRCC
jgi:hypothetical protein